MKLLPSVAIFICLAPYAAQADEKLITSYDELLRLLQNDQVTHQANRAEEGVLIPVAQAPLDSTMVIRWAGDAGVIHFVQTMELEVPDTRRAAVNDAIIRLNHGSPIPGLGLNPDTKTLYYRMSPTIAPEGGIRPQKIRTCFQHTLGQAASMLKIMQAVIDGRVASEDVVDAYNKMTSEAKIVPPGRYTTQANGETWDLTFDEDGTATLYRGDEEVVESSTTTDGAQIKFIDRSGAFQVSEVGVYEWRIQGDKLQFRVVEDAAEGRKMILTAAVWTRK